MQIYIILFIKGNKNTFSEFNNWFYHHIMSDILKSVKVSISVSI